MPKRKILTLFVSLLLLTPFYQGLDAKEVNAATGYIAITQTQTLDITYNVMQIQSNVPITQVRVGNDVINEVEG